jgi:hypothetical protein
LFDSKGFDISPISKFSQKLFFRTKTNKMEQIRTNFPGSGDYQLDDRLKSEDVEKIRSIAWGLGCQLEDNFKLLEDLAGDKKDEQ